MKKPRLVYIIASITLLSLIAIELALDGHLSAVQGTARAETEDAGAPKLIYLKGRDLQQVKQFCRPPGTCQGTLLTTGIKCFVLGKIELGSLVAVSHDGHESPDRQRPVRLYGEWVAVHRRIACCLQAQ